MLKNLLKAVITFALLLGCYFGYVRAFNLVVRQFQADRRTDITDLPRPRLPVQAARPATWPG